LPCRRPSFAAVVLFFSAVFLYVSNAGASTYTAANYPLDQNGWSVTGTITTQGDTGDLTSVDVTMTNGNLTYSMTNWELSLGSLQVSGDDLVFQPQNSTFYFDYYPNIDISYPIVNQSNEYAGYYPGNNLLWYSIPAQAPSQPGSLIGVDPMIIGTLQTSPEPATLTLLGTALLGLGVVYLRRRGAKA